MKKLKNLLISALALALIMSNVLCLPAFAASKEASIQDRDIYAEGLAETSALDGVSYTYTHYYTPEGNRAISITNNTDSVQDVVVYDCAASIIYLNGVAIGTVTENQVFGMSPRVSDYDSDGWTFVSSDSKRITWAEGIAASVLAAVIAAALNFLTGAAVLALIGANTLSIVAGAAVGAVVEASLYMLISGSYVAYQYVWTFEPDTGEVYGPYTTPLVL